MDVPVVWKTIIVLYRDLLSISRRDMYPEIVHGTEQQELILRLAYPKPASVIFDSMDRQYEYPKAVQNLVD
jgi:hypothetical protein